MIIFMYGNITIPAYLKNNLHFILKCTNNNYHYVDHIIQVHILVFHIPFFFFCFAFWFVFNFFLGILIVFS